MSYGRLFYLRFLKGFSTVELEQLFPNEKRKICVVALCSLPDQTLQNVVRENVRKRVLKIRTACFRRWGYPRQ